MEGRGRPRLCWTCLTQRLVPPGRVWARSAPHPFTSPPCPALMRTLPALQPKGSGSSSGSSMAALELVAMDMKAQGMFVCRTLSFAGGYTLCTGRLKQIRPTQGPLG